MFSLKSSKSYPITTDFEDIDNSISIAPMLLIPFIENAFKHSNIEKSKSSFIKIKIKTDSQNLILKIDNSVPLKKINKDKVGGIDLDNVKKRLDILYSERYQLNIQDNDNMFSVELNIKLTDNT